MRLVNINTNALSVRQAIAIYDDLATFFAATATFAEDAIVQAGPFFYKAAASAATDHQVTNAGGQKFYVLLDEDWQDVRKWKVLTTNTAAQNSTGLVAMRDQFIAQGNERHWKVYFPPGDYPYDNRFWPDGIRHLHISGYGAWLAPNAASGSMLPLEEAGIFNDGGDPLPYGYWGHLIDTTDVGDTTLTFKTAGDSANFSVGDRVLILSRQHQLDFYPPNPRKFQFTRVTAVGSGTITIADGCKYQYRDNDVHTSSGDWQDFGKARVMNLDRAGGTFPETRIYEGIGFRVDPEKDPTANTGFVIQGNYVYWKDVVFDYYVELWPQVADRVIFDNIRAVGQYGKIGTEADKIVVDAEYRNMVMPGNVRGGTGVQNLTFNDVELNDVSAVASERLQYNKCRFIDTTPGAFGAVAVYGGSGGGSITFTDCTAHSTTSPYIVDSHISRDEAPTSVPDTSTLRYSVVTHATFVRAAREGALIWSQDGTDVGTITSITQSGENVDFAIDWLKSSTPSTGKTYSFTEVNSVASVSGNKVIGAERFFRGLTSYDSSGPVRSVGGVMTATIAEFWGPGTFFGAGAILAGYVFQHAPRIVTELRVHVLRPYTGSDTDVDLRLTIGDAETGATEEVIDIDAKVAGQRIISIHGNTGFAAGDSGTMSRRWVHQIAVRLRNGSNAVPNYSGGSGQAPYIWIEADYIVPGHRQ